MNNVKNVMIVNAVSSGATALLLLAFPRFIAGIFGSPAATPFVGVGIFLLLFAAYVFFQSQQQPIQPGRLQLIILLDVSWVIGSLLIVLLQLFGLTFIGYLLIGGVAAWVALMALLQGRGLKQLS